MDNYLLPSLIERFVDHIKNQGKSTFTIVAYKKDLEQFAGYLTSQEKTDLREIIKEDITGFIEKLLKDNYTKKSASRKLNSIRTFFRFLKNELFKHLDKPLLFLKDELDIAGEKNQNENYIYP